MKRAMRVLSAICLACAGLVPAGRASHAADGGSQILLRGSRTAYVDVRFDEPFSLNEDEASMRYEGAYAGWFLHKVDEKVDLTRGNVAGSYVIKDFAYPGQSVRKAMNDYGFKTGTFDAGRYRMYLIADGPAEVSIPIRRGAPTMRLEPGRSASSEVAVTELSVGPAGLAADEATTPIELSRSTLGISMVTAYSDPGLTIENLAACFTEAGGDCSDTPGVGPGYVFSATDDYSVTLSTFYDPGALRRGAYEAMQTITNAGSTAEAKAAHLLLDLEGL